MITKQCTQCDYSKPLALFSNYKQGALGKKPHCKDCGARKTREWLANNVEKKKDADRAYGAKNREKLRAKRAANRESHVAYMREYHVRNWTPERAAAAAKRSRAFRAKNPELIKAWSKARKEREIIATPSWADKSAIEAIYKEARRQTKATGIQHHVDHIYPLYSKWMCGLHVETNLQITTETANLKKRNSIPDEGSYITFTSTTTTVATSAN